jgi:hypothetical protein
MTQDDDSGNVRKGEQNGESGQARKRLRGKEPLHAPRKYDFSDLMDASPFDVAFEYADNNWFLVPVDARTGKTVNEDVSEATRDPERIREWIEGQGLAVGVVTGRVSRIVALVCKGKLGQGTLKALLAARGPFPTLEGRERDATVFLFQAPDVDLESQEEVAPGVDFLGEGGYFVPLQSSWGTQNMEISPVPAWVRSLITGDTTFGIDDLVAAEGLTVLDHVTTYQAAKAYKAIGWKLMPVNPDGTDYLTATEEQCIPKLWQKRADIGLGLETGTASGIVGLWISDPALLDFWARKYDLLPQPQIAGTETVLCFQAPEEGFRSKELFNGAEYVGEKDYLVVPPSTVKGTKLRWNVGKELLAALPALPKWLHEVLSGQRQASDLIQPISQGSQKSQYGKGSGLKVQFGVEARSYAGRGWLVFPLSTGQKTPRTKSGLKDATRDLEKIAKWSKVWRNANIGVQTGANSGIVVLDVDVKNGALGLQSLADLERKHGQLVTLRASTPSGGFHLFFRAPDQVVRNRAGFLPGLDVRGDGGYVVVAPSHVGGKAYQWQNSMLPAEMPDWLLTLITSTAKKGNGASPAAQQEKLTYTDAFRGVQEGARNDTIFRFACKLRQEEWEYDEALVIIKTAAGNCEPQLEEDEAIRCLDSAWQYFPPSAISDLGNAERFVARCGASVRYIQEKDRWLVWGGHWWKTNMHSLFRMARGTIKSLRDEARAEADPSRRKALFAHSSKSECEDGFGRMLEIAACEVSIREEDLDRGDLVAFSNGVFDPRTGSLRPGRREDLLTKHVSMPYDSANPECARYLQHKGANPKVRTATIKSSKAWEERLDEWIAERCELGTFLSAGPSELLADFSSWHGEEVTAQKLGRLLSKKEGIERDKSGGRFYNGIKLRKKRKT